MQQRREESNKEEEEEERHKGQWDIMFPKHFLFILYSTKWVRDVMRGGGWGKGSSVNTAFMSVLSLSTVGIIRLKV